MPEQPSKVTLNATLFGLLLDGLHFTLADRCSWPSPWLKQPAGHNLLRHAAGLKCADDFCLLANSPTEVRGAQGHDLCARLLLKQTQ